MLDFNFPDGESTYDRALTSGTGFREGPHTGKPAIACMISLCQAESLTVRYDNGCQSNERSIARIPRRAAMAVKNALISMVSRVVIK
jgi:hypothetical protein